MKVRNLTSLKYNPLESMCDSATKCTAWVNAAHAWDTSLALGQGTNMGLIV
jgi:hypothetical protein